MFKSLFLQIIAFFAILEMLLFAFNFTVDPFGINHSPPKNDKFYKVTKPAQIVLTQPSTIVIGNSRNNYSFDVSRLQTSGAYNLSFLGATIEDIRKLFGHAVATAPIKHAYVTLDTVCTTKKSRDQSNQVLDDRFLAGIHSPTYARLQMFLVNLSYQSTMRGLLYFHRGNQSQFDSSGRITTFDEFEYKTKGPAFAMVKRDHWNAESNIADTHNPESYEDYKSSCDTSDLEHIVSLARSKNIQLTFFFNPVNMRYWVIQDKLGKLDQHYYARKLAFETIAQAYANDPVTMPDIYDFNIVSSITTDKLSASDDQESPYWYESSHYKKIVGDEMLDIMSGRKADVADSSRVYKINPETFDAFYQRNEASFYEWQRKNPWIGEEIDQILNETLQKSGS